MRFVADKVTKEQDVFRALKFSHITVTIPGPNASLHVGLTVN